LDSKPFLFLDIDGVLNSSRSAKQFGTFATFDPVCVNALNRVLKITEAQVVISSVWRFNRTAADLTKELFRQNIRLPGEVKYTPDFRRDIPRDEEIGAFLARYPAKMPYVILDDNTDMGDLLPHLVKTDSNIGLTEENADRAIEMLLCIEHVYSPHICPICGRDFTEADRTLDVPDCQLHISAHIHESLAALLAKLGATIDHPSGNLNWVRGRYRAYEGQLVITQKWLAAMKKLGR